VAAVMLLILLSVLVLHWQDRRYLTFGWLWFLGTLVPMIGIITVGEQSMADRYATFPLSFVCSDRLELYAAVSAWRVPHVMYGAPVRRFRVFILDVSPSPTWLLARR